jgi:uncharacterized membrane protein
MPQEVIDWLMVSSMIFFNILCVLAIFAILAITASVFKIRSKAVETMDLAQQTTVQVGKTIEDNSSSTLGEMIIFLVGLILPLRRESTLEKLFKNLRR